MKKQEVILSLFGGLGGSRLSAENAGLKVSKEYVSEVNQSAIKVYQHNFPDIILVGDVRNLISKDFTDVTLITGGSPCQNFSMAGTRKGMTTKTNIEVTSLTQYLKLKKEGFEFEGQSYLFWEYVRLYREIKNLQIKQGKEPLKFLLENVKMSKKWEQIITSALGVNPILIDSAKVSAQSRLRLYWTDIQGVKQPKDLGIKISDVIPGAVSGAGSRGRMNKKTGKYEYYLTIRKDNKSNTLVTQLGTITKEGRPFGTGMYVNKKNQLKMLSVSDAELLQGLPLGYTKVDGVSDSQRIFMIGNAWNIQTTTNIFEKLKKERKKIKQSK
jgi:site-specific DNA-cytosine methylase